MWSGITERKGQGIAKKSWLNAPQGNKRVLVPILFVL